MRKAKLQNSVSHTAVRNKMGEKEYLCILLNSHKSISERYIRNWQHLFTMDDWEEEEEARLYIEHCFVYICNYVNVLLSQK